MPKTISIIIPCYNGWKYFDKCLDALEKQNNSIIKEIIIVDDCSTDDSYEQLKNYAQKSSLPIKLLRNRNNYGPGKSREIAVNISTADLIAFCDCDDWYETDFTETIEKYIANENIDLLIFDTFTAFENGKKNIDHVTRKLVGKDKEYILANYPMSLCRLVVKRELIANAVHSNLRHAEDGVVVAQLIANAQSIEVIDKPLYNYYFRLDSASKKPSQDTSSDLMKAFELIQHTLPKEYNQEVEYIGIQYVCYSAILCGLKSEVEISELKKMIDKFETYYPGWIHNRYLNNMGQPKRIFLRLVKNRNFILLKIMSSIHPLLVKIKRKYS